MMSEHHEHEVVRTLLSDDRRAALVRRVRFLVIFTITYNLIEAVVALAAGAVSDSSALLAFGLDSVIEVSSAAAVAWQFSGGDHEARERIALRVIAISFFALAAFVVIDAASTLISGREPERSLAGIVLAALSLLVMPIVSIIQRRSGLSLGSQSVVADSKQTLLCTYMSAALLIGLLANVLFGWWWADPVAGLIIAALALREGVEAWRGDVCSPAEFLFTSDDEHDHDHDHDHTTSIPIMPIATRTVVVPEVDLTVREVDPEGAVWRRFRSSSSFTARRPLGAFRLTSVRRALCDVLPG